MPKQSARQAMVPEFYMPKAEAPRIKKPKKGDDDLLLSLAESDAWTLLKEIIEGMQEGITKQAKKISGKAKTWEEVGKVYYGRDVSVDTLQSVIDLVELRKHAKYAESARKEE